VVRPHTIRRIFTRRALFKSSPDRAPVTQMLATIHRPGTVHVMSDQPTPLRVPVSQAARRGVSWLNDTASDRRVVLTRFGKVASVVDSAERVDDTARVLATLRAEAVAVHADVAAGRTGRLSLDELCAKVGIDPKQVRARATELSKSAVEAK